MHSAKLPLVAIANVAGNFTLPDSARFASAVPRRLAVPDVMGNGWYSLAVGSSGMAPLGWLLGFWGMPSQPEGLPKP